MPPIFLPVDLTGEDPDNFISNEYHQVANGERAIIRPHFGDFYANGLQLYGATAQNALTLMHHGQDYVFGHLNAQATAAGAGAVYQVILVKDTRFFTTFRLSYHGFGGTNFNFPRLWNQYLKVKGGAPTAWDNLTDVPQFFEPEEHIHDVRDVYGMEYIQTFLSNIEAAVLSARGVAAKNEDIRYALRQFEAERRLGDTALPAAVRQHIDGVDYQHTYTKAMIGLPLVQNYGFVPITVGMDTLPAYASPVTIKYHLENLPDQDIPEHESLTNDPHNLTKAQVGLSDVENLDVVLDYDTGESAYEDLFDSEADEVYLGPAVLALAAQEYGEVTYDTISDPLIDDAVAEATGTLVTATGIRNSATSLMVTVNQQVAELQVDAIDVDRRASQAQANNNRFNIVYGNSYYSQTLKHLMLLDHQKHAVGQGVHPGGFLPVPSFIDGLELWLSSENPDNTLFMDINGHMRVTKLVDRSRHGRVFTAPAHTAPILKDSADVAAQVNGITTGKVMSFTPGLCLDQVSGPPIRLQPGMAVITLIRPAGTGSKLTLMAAPNELQDTGVYAFPTQALAIRSGGLWRPLEAPAGSATANTSGIIAAVVSDVSEAFCWLASTKAVDYIDFPRGVNTPASSWPAGVYTGTPLTRIGNDNFDVNNAGEIAEVIFLKRAPYAPEVKAIVEYLKLRFSDMTALSVDYVALNAF